MSSERVHAVPQGPEVVTLGESMTLLVTEPVAPLRQARTFIRSVAGAESNVAIALGRLGIRSGWIGRVGDDPFGHGILGVLRSEEVDVSHAIVDPDAPTGVLIRDRHPERRVRVMYYRSGSAGSRLSPEDLNPEYLASARIFHVTGITPALSESCRFVVEKALEVARESQITVSFDPNLRLHLWSAAEAAKVIASIAAQADLIHVGLHEGEELSGLQGRGAVAEWFLERGARLVVVKLGSQGSWATDGDEEWGAPAFPVRAVDTVGAGDAFVAGFLSAWLRENEIEECLRVGNAAGALSVQYPGDMEGMPYSSDLDALLNSWPDIDR